MNRKNFLSSLMAAGSFIPALKTTGLGDDEEDKLPVIPRYLKPGDTIGITCPAGTITELEIQPARLLMISWGFNIKLGDTVGKKDFTFGGTDDERANDFQQQLDDPSINA